MLTTCFYILLTFFLVFLCNLSKRKKNDKGVYLAYLVLFIVSAIRFDVGWDYLGYTKNVEGFCNADFTDITSLILASSGKITEPFFVALCFIFRNMETPYVWVFGCYSFFTILLVFLAINDHKFKNLDPDTNKWAIVAIIIYYFLFFIWDIQRQGLAIAMILFSYKYIEQRKLSKFLIVVLLAFLVHMSAFLAIPLYWLSKIKFNKAFAIAAVFFVLLLYLMGLFQSLQAIVQYIPHFSNYASDKNYMETFYGFSFLMLLKFIMWLLIISLIPTKQNFLGSVFIIGVVIYIISSGSHVIERFGDYYYYSIILLFPEIVKNCKKNYKPLLLLTIFITSFVCFYDMAITQKRGVMPYKTIMSDDFKKEKFKDHDFN